MRVSVVIPTLNEAEYLPQCLRSLSEHGGDAVTEIFVVDAGSSDDTVAIAEAANATVLKKEKDTIAGQRNLGAAIATGDLLAFLDADCTINPGWAENAVRHFADPHVVSAGAPPDIPDNNTTWVQQAWSFLKRKSQPRQMDVSWLASANVWVRKSSFDQIGGFDANLETCEDADLGFRLNRLGRTISDPGISVQHHREPRTLTHFYKKEVWHGKHSYDGLLKGRLTLAEIPSLVTPFLFVGSFVLMVVGILTTGPWGHWILLTGIAGLFAAPVAYTLRAVLKKGQWLRSPQYLLVYFVYFAARADALVRACWRLIVSPFQSKTAKNHAT
ncbi:glycosyltransferase [Stieleria varia]|uniref:Putative glycosyltransferase EpsH n=1 Tax=Stieleria varia TaxID=2528005 RepID=A0A5C6AP39_9BACT|nr:glycosyltransferase [Stieleria varia]TWU01277.1 putative glycosyltransferase EpsH [Stieleria varia]